MSQNADVNKVISEGSALALGNVDMKQMIRSLYPLLQMAQAGAAQFTGKAAPFDVSKFPPVDIVEKHLANSTYALSRVQDGVEYSSFESVPGMGPQAAAPITVALLLPAVQATRTAAQRVQTSNDLRQIGLGLHNYNSVNGAFPAPYSTDSSGKPLLSWRVHVLPFIEQESLYKEFHLDEPWDSPHNLKLVEQMPDAYTSAAADPTGGKTTVLGVAGKGGLFEATKGNQPRSPKGLSLAAITDGTSNTIAVVEAPEQFAVTWTKPDDFDASVGNAAQKLCENRPGFNVLFCDGRVTYLATAIDKRILAGMFTTNGREPVPPIGR